MARKKLSKKKGEKPAGSLQAAFAEWHKEKPMVAMRMETMFLMWLHRFPEVDREKIIANINKGRTNDQIKGLIRDIVLSYKPASTNKHKEQDELAQTYELLKKEK